MFDAGPDDLVIRPIDELSKVMNGNPRGELLDRAEGAAGRRLRDLPPTGQVGAGHGLRGRQQPREVFFNALATDLVDRFRARTDEDLLEVFLAAVLVIGDGDLGGALGQRPQALESFFQTLVEAAPDLAGPADVERARRAAAARPARTRASPRSFRRASARAVRYR